MSGGQYHSSDIFESVHRFVMAGAGDDLTDAQWADFERLLRDDDAKRTYAKYVSMLVLLPSVLNSVGDDESSDVDALSACDCPTPALAAPIHGTGSSLFGPVFGPVFGGLAAGWPAAYLVATVIFSIGLTIGALVHVSNPSQVVKDASTITDAPQTVPPIANAVGRITNVVNCRWADESTAAVLGAYVPLGRKFALSSGLMEITYDRGAKVILQGPVNYEVESPAGGYLSIGKLTAKLEQRSEVGGQKSESANHQSSIINHQFAVRTPTAIVTDLGTEFGVEVSPVGATSTHVFRGTVEVAVVPQQGQMAQTVRLKANESADVARAERSDQLTIHRGQANPVGFVRAADLPTPMQLEGRNALQCWQTHLETIHCDPALVVHYDFQRHAESPNVLHADASGNRSPLDGRIEGAAWTTGHLPGKQALRFDGDQSRVKIQIPGELTHVTLAAWLAIQSIGDSNLGCCLLVADWSNTFAEKAAWQIYRQGELRFGTPVCDSETPPLLPWRTWGSNRWRHLVVAANPSERQVAYYIDGKKVSTLGISDKFVARFGSAQIGNWWSNNDRNERGFCGRMDDLMIFARALTDREVLAMYEAGKK